MSFFKKILPVFVFLLTGVTSYAQTCGNGISVYLSVYSDYNGEHISCNGACDGSINVDSVAGTGVGPYSYSLNGGLAGTDTIFNSLCAGIYSVTVVDSGQVGNPSCLQTITLTAPSAIGFTSVTPTHITCNAADDGIITAVGTGGTTPYQYDIGGAQQASGTFNSLMPGAYTVTIEDANGCSTTQGTTINEPTVLTSSLSGSSDVNCNGGNDGSLTVSASGGTTAYQYSIDGGSTWQGSGAFTGLVAGTYDVDVEDANGCTSSVTGTVISEPAAALVLSEDATTEPSCNGFADGQIQTSAAGGTTAYQYSIDGGPFGGSGTFSGLAAGTYEIVVDDANGCRDTIQSTLTDPAALQVSATGTDVVCGVSEGSIDVDESYSGTDPYVYEINGGGQQGCCITGTEETGLSAGLYTVVFTDTLTGCTQTFPIAIGTTGGLSTPTVVVTDETCAGNNDGTLNVTADAGAAPPVQYSIDGGSTFQGTGAFSNLGGGSYNIVTTDDNGCSATTSEVVGSNPSVTVQIDTVYDNVCAYDTDGQIFASATGGTGSLVYSIDSTNWQNYPVFTNLDSGIYTVYVADGIGCTATASDTVDLLSNPPVDSTFTLGLNGGIYSQQSPDINLEDQASPLTSQVYSYIIYGDGVWNDSLHFSVLPISGFGQYYTATYQITDSAGCTYTSIDSFQVASFPINTDATPPLFNGNQPGVPPIAAPPWTADAVFCEGETTNYTVMTQSPYGGFFYPSSSISSPNPGPSLPPSLFYNCSSGCGTIIPPHQGEGTATFNVSSLAPGLHSFTYAEWNYFLLPIPDFDWCSTNPCAPFFNCSISYPCNFHFDYKVIWQTIPYTFNFIVAGPDAGVINVPTDFCSDGNPVVISSNSNLQPGGFGAGLEYQWSASQAGALVGPTNVATPTFDPQAVTGSVDLTLTVNDDGGKCYDAVTQTVTINPLPVLDVLLDTVLCPYEDQVIYGTANGDTLGNFLPFSVTDNQAPNDGIAEIHASAMPDSAFYTFKFGYTDNKGCTDTIVQQIFITENKNPRIDVQHYIDNPYSAYVPPMETFYWPQQYDIEVCSGDSVEITSLLEQGPTYVQGGDLSWGTNSSTSGNLTDLAINNGLYPEDDTVAFFYTETIGGTTCNYYDTLTITINPTPTPNIVWFGDENFCATAEDSLAIQLIPDNSYAYQNQDSTQLFFNSLQTGQSYQAPVGGGFINTMFDPSFPYVDSLGDTIELVFHYINPVTGCWADAIDSLIVRPLPTASFTVDSACVNTDITFISDSLYANADYLWFLDDAGAYTGDTVIAQFPTTDTQYVWMEITTQYGCQDRFDTSLVFGLIPDFEFDWGLGCIPINGGVPQDPVQFQIYNYLNDSSTYFWDYGDGDTLTTINENDPHAYGQFATYSVNLTATTDLGCAKTVGHLVHVQPIVNTFPYFDDLNTVPYDQAWHIDSESSTNSTWGLGIPQGFFSGTDNAFVTDTVGNYDDDEHSYVEGPCFDLSSLQRPMIKLDTWSEVGDDFGTRDGATFEYLSPTDSIWKTLGDTINGINWYNTNEVWTRDSIDPSFNTIQLGETAGWTGNDGEWKDSRYKLDGIQDNAYIKVRVRFASDAAVTGGGFAFDNVWIGERTKRVLVEQMTNILDPTCDGVNYPFDSAMVANALDAIDIQYHTESPSGDPMWAAYPSGGNARSLYYGLGDTIPYTLQDGNLYQGGTQGWLDDNHVFRSNSLLDAGFLVDLTGSSINTTTGEVTVNTKLEALRDFLTEDIRLYIAVVEYDVNFDGYNSRNVVRQMLPNPGGEQLPMGWYMYDTLSMTSHTWLANNIDDPTNLRIIAFVQNYETKEVYQAADDQNFQLATEIVEGEEVTNAFIVYPNPTEGQSFVQFNEPLDGSYAITLYDNLGKAVQTINNAVGQRFELNVAGMSRGIYYVHVQNDAGSVAVRKLIVQ